ncbi:alpha/beta hydrolase [Pseudoalteromonas lipolytica]|uniref:alpha/beta hydrolase n=1 Tax=Pseudoalteromonas lipolytica TaxID=570156 RepID=UPI0004AE0E22|nr:alpha/beta hydrolase-fold protein [Pseudoalteromonas lipolytica]
MNLRVIKNVVLVGILLAAGAAAFFKMQQYKEDYASDFVDETIYSSVLDENRKIFVRLPSNYERSKKYPLIIKTDGNFNLKRWDETLAELSSQDIAEDSIIVAIPNLFWVDSRNRDLVPPYARRDVSIEARPENENHPDIFGKADVFLTFIETELIPYLEKNYSINDNRLLSGFSAGGSFVLYTIVTKPNLFSGYFAFSPAAWYDDSVVVKEFAKNLPATEGKSIFLYLSLGEEENEIITGSFKGLLSALETNAPDNLQWADSYSKGAGHNANPYVSVPKALTKYYEFWSNKI